MLFRCARPSWRSLAMCVLAYSCVLICSTSVPAEDKFDIPAPTDLGSHQRLTLWSTYYYVHSAQPVAQGTRLLRRDGHSFGVSLSNYDWCHAAVEGTVEVRTRPKSRSFNYAGVAGSSQVNCRPFFPSLDRVIERTRYAELPPDAPLGLGDTPKFRLVAFRSIAVDRRQPHFQLLDGGQLRKVVIYIPKLKGIRLQMPDGSVRDHDGYLFAADTGGAIRGAHIDFFLGASTRNPAPSVIGSRPETTFAAHVIEDAAVQEKLFKLHARE